MRATLLLRESVRPRRGGPEGLRTVRPTALPVAPALRRHRLMMGASVLARCDRATQATPSAARRHRGRPSLRYDAASRAGTRYPRPGPVPFRLLSPAPSALQAACSPQARSEAAGQPLTKPVYPLKFIWDGETEYSPTPVSGKAGLHLSLKSLSCATLLWRGRPFGPGR